MSQNQNDGKTEGLADRLFREAADRMGKPRILPLRAVRSLGDFLGVKPPSRN